MKELDPLLHSQLRLAVMSILMNVDEADFVYLKEKTDATAGNLSVQLDKLSSAGYITVEKGFAGKKTRSATTGMAATITARPKTVSSRRPTYLHMMV